MPTRPASPWRPYTLNGSHAQTPVQGDDLFEAIGHDLDSAEAAIATKAALGHTHIPTDVTGLDSEIDARIALLPWKSHVRVASPVNVTISSPGAAIDGVAMAVDDVVLLHSQTVALECGPYVWNGPAIPMTRSSDGNTGDKLYRAVYVPSEGTLEARPILNINTSLPTINVTPLIFQVGFTGSTSHTYIIPFDAEVLPTSPSTLDDEFTAATLDPKWLLVNWAGLTSASLANLPGALTCVNPSNAGNSLRAILQVIPIGDFTIYSRLQRRCAGAGASIGIILSDGIVFGSGTQLIVSLETVSTVSAYGVNKFTGFNAFSSTPVAYTNFNDNLLYVGLFVRLRRVSAAYYAAVSRDGQLWEEFAITPGFTPAYFGLFVNNNGSGQVQTAIFHFFRYFASGTAALGGSRTVLVP